MPLREKYRRQYLEAMKWRRQRVGRQTGEVVTPQLVGKLAVEAEKGYDLARAKKKRVATPIAA
jgi:hypothetical protein